MSTPLQQPGLGRSPTETGTVPPLELIPLYDRISVKRRNTHRNEDNFSVHSVVQKQTTLPIDITPRKPKERRSEFIRQARDRDIYSRPSAKLLDKLHEAPQAFFYKPSTSASWWRSSLQPVSLSCNPATQVPELYQSPTVQTDDSKKIVCREEY